MTDEEVSAFYDKLVEFFGDQLPNYELHPKSFAYYVKLYRYYMSKNTNLEIYNEEAQAQ